MAEAPLTLLPALSQQPDTLYAFVDGPYRNLPGHLNRLVTEYAAERLAQAGAVGLEPEPILASVRVTDAGYVNVRRFLQSHGVPPTYSDAELQAPPYRGKFEASGFPQLVPVHLLGLVSELPGVIYVGERSEAVIDLDPADGPQSRVRQQTTGTTNVARNHGAEAWHMAGITGNGVKVGIIDYGFRDFRTRLPNLTPAAEPFCCDTSGKRG